MTQITINFNGGNPFTVGPNGVHSETHTLPATVSQAELDLLDPNGAWVNPANASKSFCFGIQYSPDGGTTWKLLSGIGVNKDTMQPDGTVHVGAVDPRDGALPIVTTSRNTGITEAYGMLCRAFAVCTPGSVSIAAQAIITT